MTDTIGPTFADEIVAAGYAGLPFTWGADGGIQYGAAITPEQRAGIEAVLAAHDPTRQLPKSFLARDLLEQLIDEDQTGIETALASNVTWRRIWNALLAQGDAPISMASSRAQAGWAGLTQALGQTRVDEITAALGIAT